MRQQAELDEAIMIASMLQLDSVFIFQSNRYLFIGIQMHSSISPFISNTPHVNFSRVPVSIRHKYATCRYSES